MRWKHKMNLLFVHVRADEVLLGAGAHLLGTI